MGRPACRVVSQAILLASAVGCGYRRGFTRYAPVPLATPEQRAAAFAERHLTDPRLDSLLRASGVAVPAAVPRETATNDTARRAVWTPRALGMAAVFFNPELDTARAGLRVRRAAVLTARQRPQPGVNGSTNLSGASGAVAAGFAQALTATFTIETAGKRGARIDSARAGVLATALRVRALGWRVAFDAQDAATRARAADLVVGDARTERDLLVTVLALLRARYAQGSASASDLARTASDLQSAVVAVTQAAQAQAQARDSLARALGVPVDEARAIRLGPPAPASPIVVPPMTAAPSMGALVEPPSTPATCAALDTLPPDRLQTVALRQRYDLGAALGDYATAEADVRLQVTRQYPNVALGPGLTLGSGPIGWIFGVGLPNLVLNRNRGPIAEAEARRVTAARLAEQVQQQVLRDLVAARVECQGAAGQLAAADSLARAADLAFRLAAASYNRGEVGRTEVALAQLTAFRASRARRTAQERVDLAGVLLERSVGGWLSPITLPDAVLLRDPRPPEPRDASAAAPPASAPPRR